MDAASRVEFDASTIGYAMGSACAETCDGTAEGNQAAWRAHKQARDFLKCVISLEWFNGRRTMFEMGAALREAASLAMDGAA